MARSLNPAIRKANDDALTRSVSFRIVRVVLLSGAFALPFVLMTGKSITGDEVAHIPAGYSYLVTQEVVLNPMHPPLVKELCALPLLFLGLEIPVDAATIRTTGKDFTYQWEFGQQFFLRQNLQRVLFWSRIPAALLSLALAWLVMRWATELWGALGGLLALFLYVVDPNITAHAELVTTDVGCALFSTLFVYLLRRFALQPNRVRLLVAGVALGAALGAKFSCVVLVPIAALLLGAIAVTSAKPVARLASFAASLLAMCVVAYGVLWAMYFFPTDPFFYLRGLRDVKGDYDPRYLHFFMGELRHEGWRSYFLVAWLIKTPLPELMFVFAGAALAIAGFRNDWREEVFLVVPLLGLFAGYSLFADPIGVRYVIPCLPFVFILTGRLVPALSVAPRVGTVAASGFLLWSVIEFAAIWPDHLSYFNQIAGGWRGGVDWLDDSNVDWGQGYLELREYLKSRTTTNARLCDFGKFNPAYYGFDGKLVWLDDLVSRPEPGTLILSSHCVGRVRAWLDSHPAEGQRNWLRDLEPETVVGHVYWVYEIPAPMVRP